MAREADPIDEVEYYAGEDVFVVDPSFEPVVQRGTVGLLDSEASGRGIDVGFERDPFDAGSDERRSISVDPDQIVHADADTVEVYRLIGIEIDEEARAERRGEL